ncbi:hypothetical protein QA633_40035 [Bradyrhizobium barranii]|uniref:hypothetical protein n=1 Tax=Bradyrhizobium barranii TaxID=2992140 RepID=UPI0024AF8908|nr:hypothetical protein [Bradyrhizobium barranii]WFT94382.1 hypothetical protein QA633_40035 [Bradyrhizobium barranii]
MDVPTLEEVKSAVDNQPQSPMLLLARLGLLASIAAGLFKLTPLVLIPCILAVLMGEALRLYRRARPHRLPFSVILGLLFSSTLYCGMMYGVGRAITWVADYFGWAQ